jgi:hypothetical protein
MTILDVIKSGKRFRRKGYHTAWFSSEDIVLWLNSDVLAEDWEVEENSITITESVLKAAWEKACQSSGYHDDRACNPPWLYAELKKELGL